MDPALILFGIQAIIRLGKIGKDASEQYVRDAEALFPDIRKPEFDRRTYVNGFFGDANYEHFVKGPDAPYRGCWGSRGVINIPNSIDTLFAAAVRIKSEEGIDMNSWLCDSQAIAGAVLIGQWDPDKPAPLSPFARIILAAGDIALQYVAVNPGLLEVGGNGQKLIGAFAWNLSSMLPDDGNFGDSHRFAERLLGLFLRAGLDTINNNPGLVVCEEHMQRLISNSVEPILKAFPSSITEQVKYREVTEALIGPAANAAMHTLAMHPGAFFGDDFGAETAIGALTEAMLGQATKTGLNNRFTRDGLLDLYRAALGVAAEKPQLFLKEDGEPREQLARELIGSFAEVLVQATPPFDGTVGIQLAATALEAVSVNAHRFARGDKPWEETASVMLADVTKQLAEAFRANKGIETVFTRTQLIELGRIVFNHIASTPEMIVGRDEALAAIMGTVTYAMSRDHRLLFNADDWLEIAKVAAEEAAANPGRLFVPDPDDPARSLAARAIGALLDSATPILDQEELRGKSVLFGRTLREAVIIVLRASSANPGGAGKYLDGIELLSTALNEFVAGNADGFGSREWLALFQLLLPQLLGGRKPVELTVASAGKMLREGVR